MSKQIKGHGLACQTSLHPYFSLWLVGWLPFNDFMIYQNNSVIMSMESTCCSEVSLSPHKHPQVWTYRIVVYWFMFTKWLLLVQLLSLFSNLFRALGLPKRNIIDYFNLDILLWCYWSEYCTLINHNTLVMFYIVLFICTA